MKIWYQSMSRFETKWKSYPKYLRRILDQVKDPDTEIEVHGITKIGGFADQYRYLEYLETGEVMENVHTAMARGFDAFLIGNIADPGLRECREIANFPVLGLCETSLHVACMMGANFSLVTINEKFTPRIVENVVHYGLKERLAAVNRMKVDRILNLDDGFENADVQRDLIGQFQAAAKAQHRCRRRGGDRGRRRGDGAARARRRLHDAVRRADPQRHHHAGEDGRDGGEARQDHGRHVHQQAAAICAARPRPDRRDPRILRRQHLSDREAEVTQQAA